MSGVNYVSLAGNGNPAGGPGVQVDTVDLPKSIGILRVAPNARRSLQPGNCSKMGMIVDIHR